MVKLERIPYEKKMEIFLMIVLEVRMSITPNK